MNNKKRSFITILILLILIVCLSISSIYFKFNDLNSEKVNIGIVDYKLFKDKTIEYYNDDLYFVRNNNGRIEILDYNLEKYIEIDCDNLSSIKIDNGYLINTNKGSYVLSNNKTVLFKSDNNIQYLVDAITGNCYYLESKDNSIIIYDKDFKEVIRFNNGDSNFNIKIIVSGRVYADNNNIYDIKSGTVVDTYKKISYLGDKYYVIEHDSSVDLIDRENRNIKITEIYKYKNESYVFNFNGKELVIGNDGTIYDNVDRREINGYYIDARTCDVGWKLKDKEDNMIYDKCSYSYDLTHIDDGVFIIKTLDSVYMLSVRGVTTSEYKMMNFQGDYVYALGNQGIIFDLKGFTAFNEYENITSFNYIGNNQYQISTLNNVAYILNKDIKEVAKYDEVDCYNDVCITKKDNKYGLFYEGQEQVENKLFKIERNNDIYIFRDVAFDAIVKIGKVKKQKEINEILENCDNYYADIDINEIVEQYKLEQMIGDINKDKDFFRKYAYVIENNNGILGYKDKMFQFYKAVIDNKNFINEDYLLNNLKQLKIREKSEVSIKGAAGVYLDNGKEIELLKEYAKPSVYYHEIYHFLDFNANYEKKDYRYVCDNKVYNLNSYNSLDNYTKGYCSTFNSPHIQFIVEAGAETYTTDYFSTYGNNSVYLSATYIYELLNYIFGNNVMEDIFYSASTNDEFYKMIVETYGMPYNDYESMIKTFNDIINLDTLNNMELIEKAKEWIVYLYKLKYPSNNPDNDIELQYYLKYGYGLKEYNNNYSNELHNINENILINYYGSRRGYNISSFKVKDNGTYIYFDILDSKYSIIEKIRVLYNFNTNTVLEYKKIEGV